jgi:hypothetical protein
MHTIILHFLSFHIRPLKIRIMMFLVLDSFVLGGSFRSSVLGSVVFCKHFFPQTVLLCSPAAPATSMPPARSIASLLKGCARPKDKPDGRHSIPEGVNACSNAATAVNDSHDEDTGQASSVGGASQDSCSRKDLATGNQDEMITKQPYQHG